MGAGQHPAGGDEEAGAPVPVAVRVIPAVGSGDAYECGAHESVEGAHAGSSAMRLRCGGVGCGRPGCGNGRGVRGGVRRGAGGSARFGPGQGDVHGGLARAVGEDSDHLAGLRRQFDAEADGDLHGALRVESGPQRADHPAHHVREAAYHGDHPVLDAGVLEPAAPAEFLHVTDPGPHGRAVVQPNTRDPVRHSAPAPRNDDEEG